MTIDDTAAPASAAPIAEYSATDAALATLREEFAGATFDVTTAAGMVAAKAARARIRDYRVSLEKMRVEIKAPALERCRAIDSEAKRITAELVALESPIDTTIKAEEQRKAEEKAAAIKAEQAAAEAFRQRVNALRNFPLRAVNKPAAEIAEIIAAAESIDHGDLIGDQREEADVALQAAILRLRDMHEWTAAQEIERARLRAEREEADQLRAEQDRQATAARVAQEAELAAARAESEALRAEADSARAEADAAVQREADAIAERERQDRERVEAAEQAERDRVEEAARVERERVAAEARTEAARKAEVERVEAERKAEAERAEAARKVEAERIERDRRIANATLLDAAEAAVLLLVSLGMGHREETRALDSAIAREGRRHAA